MAAFERLQQLGEEKFQTIINELMRGTAAMALARKIQQEWGDFTDVKEASLTQQLNRFRLAAAEGSLGAKIAKQIAKGATPQIALLEGVSSDVLTRMEELAKIGRDHVVAIDTALKLAKPQHQKDLEAKYKVFTVLVEKYGTVLKDIQKLRFDLGLDHFQGVIPGIRGESMTARLPDGTVLQRAVYQASMDVDEVLRRNGIGLPKG